MITNITASGWFPVLTLLLGYGLKSLTEWVQHRRVTAREREARISIRRDQLAERRTEFQRQTLLDLQEACLQLARATGAIKFQDEIAYQSTGSWGKQQVVGEWDEGCRVAQARTLMLGVRVRDKMIRDFVEQMKMHSFAVTTAKNIHKSNNAMSSMISVQADLNLRIGVILRELDDQDE